MSKLVVSEVAAELRKRARERSSIAVTVTKDLVVARMAQATADISGPHRTRLLRSGELLIVLSASPRDSEPDWHWLETILNREARNLSSFVPNAEVTVFDRGEWLPCGELWAGLVAFGAASIDGVNEPDQSVPETRWLKPNGEDHSLPEYREAKQQFLRTGERPADFPSADTTQSQREEPSILNEIAFALDELAKTLIDDGTVDVTLKMLMEYANCSRSVISRALKGQSVRRERRGKADWFVYSELLPILRDQTKPKYSWPATVNSLKSRAKNSK